MNSQQHEAAAQLIARTRELSDVLSGLPRDLEPATAADAYAVQDVFRRLWPDAVAGWKAGATNAAVQAKLQLPEPIAGPFYRADTYASPARVEARRFPHLCLESEFAFRFGRRLPARGVGYDKREILAAVDALVPAIELVGPRFDTLLAGRGPTAIADCSLNAGFVLGKPVLDWQPDSLARHPVILRVNGEERARGDGSQVLGDPLVALAWTVAHLGSRGIDIEPGQILSTGTTTGICYIGTGDEAVADFGSLGHVEVTFTGPAHPKAVRPA